MFATDISSLPCVSPRYSIGLGIEIFISSACVPPREKVLKMLLARFGNCIRALSLQELPLISTVVPPQSVLGLHSSMVRSTSFRRFTRPYWISTESRNCPTFIIVRAECSLEPYIPPSKTRLIMNIVFGDFNSICSFFLSDSISLSLAIDLIISRVELGPYLSR